MDTDLLLMKEFFVCQIFMLTCLQTSPAGSDTRPENEWWPCVSVTTSLLLSLAQSICWRYSAYFVLMHIRVEWILLCHWSEAVTVSCWLTVASVRRRHRAGAGERWRLFKESKEKRLRQTWCPLWSLFQQLRYPEAMMDLWLTVCSKATRCVSELQVIMWRP